MIVQIYEIQTRQEAECIIELGVDHVGSVLVSASAWKSDSLKETIACVRQMGAVSSVIPLFSDYDTVCAAISWYQPHIVHFCETLTGPSGISDACGVYIDLQARIRKVFPGIRIMRSIPVGPPGQAGPVPTLALAEMFEPVSDLFLTDTFLIPSHETQEKEQPVNGFVGITGQICDWDMARMLVKRSAIPVILAGGLSPENVCEGIRRVQPADVDSCTQTNARGDDGSPVRFKKDLQKVRMFVDNARQNRSCVSGAGEQGK